MNMKKNRISCSLLLSVVVALAFLQSLASAQSVDKSGDLVYLNQAWTAEDRAQFYWAAQGSALLSYDIYLALEVPGTNELFNSPANTERMGLLIDPVDLKNNPDNLPVGVAKSEIKAGVFKGTYAGLTCAACHTNQIQYKGTQIRIDGGNASRFDTLLWLQTLSASIEAPLNNPVHFDSLMQRIRSRGPVDEQDLRTRLKADAEFIKLQLTDSFVVPFPPGPGRTDAFTEEGNTVISIHTGIKENSRPAVAPVKPPFLWNVPHSAWVEWSGIEANPLVRNFSEVMGVFARFDASANQKNLKEIESTIDLKGIVEIENMLRRLAPPAWPAQVLGKLNQARVMEGSTLFEKHCLKCHSSYPYRWSMPRANGVRMIENALVPLEIIGTDKQHLMTPLLDSSPSAMSKHLAELVNGKSKVTPGELFSVIQLPMIAYALKRSGPFTSEEILSMNGYVDSSFKQKPPVKSFKAAPREGAWSTAPFLHNGSVPNLYELLSPLTERSKTFYINREFDPVKLGVDTTKTSTGFLFDTSLIGNSNSGHLFENKKAPGVIGPELSPAQRYALIEYIKSIPDVPGRITPFGGPPNPVIAEQDQTWFNYKHPYGQ